MTVVAAVSDWYLEIEFDPTCDLRAIEQIARICGGANLTEVCKVSVIFVRGDLTDKSRYVNSLEEEAARELQCRISFPEETDEGAGRGSEDPQ